MEIADDNVQPVPCVLLVAILLFFIMNISFLLTKMSCTTLESKEDMIFAASILINLGAKNVFIKGGHLNSKIVQDIFVNKKEIFIIKNKRIATSDTHGTGCTLASAISNFFACGKTLKKSCELATKYVNHSIRSNLNYGKGHGPINHLSSIVIDKKFR